jgi:hypothetical protein
VSEIQGTFPAPVDAIAMAFWERRVARNYAQYLERPDSRFLKVLRHRYGRSDDALAAIAERNGVKVHPARKKSA